MTQSSGGAPAPAISRRPAVRRSVIVLVVLTAILLLTRLMQVGDISPFDPNEGWNAFQAVAAMGGGPLYPPPGGLTANNYPPLSFYLIGWFGTLTGDMVLAGRIVAFGSVLTVAAMAGLIARRLTGRGLAGAAAAITVLLFAGSVFRAYLAMNDPQWLGLAFTAASLAIVLHRPAGERIPLATAFCSALLAAAGVLTKHNALAIPAAAGFYLLLHDRRALAVWITVAASTMAGVVIADRMAFDGAMLANVLGAPRSYSLQRMLTHALIVILFLPLLAASWRLKAWRATEPRIDALLLGTLLAVILAVIQGSGAGVDVNAWFEALVFVAILLGAGLTAPVAPPPIERWAPLLIALIAVILVGYGAVMSAEELGQRNARLAASKDAIARVAAVPGPVACEIQAYCYWAGKGFALDYFLYGENMRQTGSAAQLDLALQDGRITAALVEGSRDRVMPPAQAFMLARMRVSHEWPERRLLVR